MKEPDEGEAHHPGLPPGRESIGKTEGGLTPPPLGATCLDGRGCRFVVWAPRAHTLDIHIVSPQDRMIAMVKEERGYFHAEVEDLEPGALYRYRLNGTLERPDPASRSQPQGVHGPSEVVDLAFPWDDAGWGGVALRDYVLYELHVGTFTSEGTFDAVIPRLEELKDLGVTAVELMPVAQFPGSRNWGYDGTYPYASQNSYGGARALQRLVNACHRHGLSAVLDVVYNHLGPEGNYLADFGPYFTDRYRTPWGEALNFDGRDSDEVRRYFVENALHWITHFHFDALRLDAIHAILDTSAQPFLAELATAVHAASSSAGRPAYVIAESNRNDARIVARYEAGGYQLDGVWNDDLHHALHVVLTQERDGYYQDFGTLEQLARALGDGFVYSGQYSAYRGRRHGNSSRLMSAERFVVFAQNHDQVGNRRLGERLAALISFEAQKLAAAVVMLSPFIPLLFMGEEYGETAPFRYFVSHSDPALVEAVRKGRTREFASFDWKGSVPDPQDEATFRASRINWPLRTSGHHALMRAFCKELLRLRRQIPALSRLDKKQLEATPSEPGRTLFLRRWSEGSQIFALFSFGTGASQIAVPLPEGRWKKELDSTDKRWGGADRGPDEIDSPGQVSLLRKAPSVALFGQGKGSSE